MFIVHFFSKSHDHGCPSLPGENYWSLSLVMRLPGPGSLRKSPEKATSCGFVCVSYVPCIGGEHHENRPFGGFGLVGTWLAIPLAGAKPCLSHVLLNWLLRVPVHWRAFRT